MTHNVEVWFEQLVLRKALVSSPGIDVWGAYFMFFVSNAVGGDPAECRLVSLKGSAAPQCYWLPLNNVYEEKREQQGLYGTDKLSAPSRTSESMLLHCYHQD